MKINSPLSLQQTGDIFLNKKTVALLKINKKGRLLGLSLYITEYVEYIGKRIFTKPQLHSIKNKRKIHK